jgi:toxin ParE1/3/4
MPRAIIAPAAARDLIEIHDYIARDNPAAARRLLGRLEAKVKQLANSPGTGRHRDELLPGLRSFAVRSYVIFYRAIPGGIEVIRVLHARRDIDAILGQGD